MLQTSFGRNKKWTHNKIGIIYLSEFSSFKIKALQDLWPSVFRFIVTFLLNVSKSCNKSQRVNGAQISELTQTGVGWADAIIREHCMHWARTSDWSWHPVFHKTPAQWSEEHKWTRKHWKQTCLRSEKMILLKYMYISWCLGGCQTVYYSFSIKTLVKIVLVGRGVLKGLVKNLHFRQLGYLFPYTFYNQHWKPAGKHWSNIETLGYCSLSAC